MDKVKRLKEEISQGNTRSKRREVDRPEGMKTGIKQPEEYMAFEEQQSSSEELIENVLLTDTRFMPPHEAFSYALEEIRKAIKAEFSALRAELKLWREGG